MSNISDQVVISNALKEMLTHEDTMAEKYAQLATQINEPKINQMLKGMEQSARNHHSTLAQTMEKFVSPTKEV